MTNPCSQEERITEMDKKVAVIETSLSAIKDDVNTIKKSVLAFVCANFIFFVTVIFGAGITFNKVNTHNDRIHNIEEFIYK